MKKKIVVMVCLSTIFMQGMEHCWEIMVHGTKIELLKGNNGDVFMYTKDTDFIVVGQYEQQALGGHQTWRNPVGVCSISKEISFLSNKYNQFANIIALENILKVTEPYLISLRKDYKKYPIGTLYYRRIMKSDKNVMCSPIKKERYFKGRAMEEACKDLSLCYTNVLTEVLERAGQEQHKGIVIPTLGTKYHDEHNIGTPNGHNFGTPIGIPTDKAAKIAVESILDFIKNNAGSYDCIKLFVPEFFEFDVYKELLMQWRSKENLFLLYLAQKKGETIFASVPRDVVSYILNML